MSRQKHPLFVQDEYGRTSLFYAAEKGDEAKVRKIIFSLMGTGIFPQRLGLISIQDHQGNTAADVAEQNGHTDIAQLLRGEQFRMEYFE